MKYMLDTHTHTLASGHAYSTVTEMIDAARGVRLSLLCITEHAPKMPGTCHEYYFQNLRILKGRDFGIEVLFGTELNILDFEGHVDLGPSVLHQLDICIASIHLPCMVLGSARQNTDAYINAMKNPYVDIIGHPDDGRIPLEYERLVEAAKKSGVALELNNSSLTPTSFRDHAAENDKIYLSLCKEYEVPITLGSDAHFCDDIANFSYADKLLCELDFPDRLILNTSVQKLKDHLKRPRG